MLHGKHLVKHWSSTQATIALSSGEAELTAVVKGSTQALGMVSMARDLGLELAITVFTDSKAGKAMASRKGVGKVRHLEVADLWIQDAVRLGKIKLEKVDGLKNMADMLTKYIPAANIETHCTGLHVFPARGRSEIAPEIQTAAVFIISDNMANAGATSLRPRGSVRPNVMNGTFLRLL